MSYIKILGIPKLLFAHKFSADSYENFLPIRENKFEVSFFVKGKCRNVVENKKIDLVQNDILCNPFTSSVQSKTTEFHEHHTVCFNVPFTISKAAERDYLNLPYITHSGDNGGKVLYLIDEIIRQSALNAGQKLTVAGLFFNILDILNDLNVQKKNNSRYSDVIYVEEAKRYVYENLHKQISQKEVALALGITPEYLCNVFKKIEGVNLIKFTNETKLEKIRATIKNENVKLYQATEMYGFNDPNYVSRLFKKYYGKNITD